MKSVRTNQTALAQPCAQLSVSSSEFRECANRHKPYILIVSVVVSGLAFIDGAIVNVVLPMLREALDAKSTELQWMIESYMLTLSALMLLSGSLGKRFGIRRTFLAAVMIFLIASIACALATSPEWLIIARAFQGMGGAWMIPISLTLLGTYFTKEEQGRAIGIWTASTAASMALGSVGGAWLAEQFGWPAIFWMNVPLLLIALFMAVRHIPLDQKVEERVAIDWRGAGLMILSITLIITGFIEQKSLGWTHPIILFSFVAGVLLFVLFIRSQRHRHNAMLPLHLFQNGLFSRVNLLTFLIYGALGSYSFLIPFRLIELHGFSPSEAAAAALPIVLCVFILSPLIGKAITRVGWEPFLGGGSLLLAFGLGYIGYSVHWSDQSFLIALLPGIILSGIGVAFVASPLTFALLQIVHTEEVSIASAINNTISRFSGLIFIAIITALCIEVMQLSSDTVFNWELTAPNDGADASTIAAYEHAFRHGFSAAFYTLSACALLSAVLAFMASTKGRRVADSG